MSNVRKLNAKKEFNDSCKNKKEGLLQQISLRQRVCNHFGYEIVQEFLSCLVKLCWPSPKQEAAMLNLESKNFSNYNNDDYFCILYSIINH